MNIIAVDDEKLALETLVRSIRTAETEANVYSFREPENAVEFVKNNECNVAFLDIKMRLITGIELAKKLKQINPKLNIVFVTGFSDYTLEAFRLYASDYILKPATSEQIKQALLNLRNPVEAKAKNRVRIQCFGDFEIFVDEKPLIFKRAKAKEIVAYLVDRVGSSVTMGELMTVLWDSGEDSISRKSNLRNLVSEVKRAFDSVGVYDVILKGRNSISLNKNVIECDYYDYIKGVPYAINKYRGEYMLQYSWADYEKF